MSFRDEYTPREEAEIAAYEEWRDERAEGEDDSWDAWKRYLKEIEDGRY